MTTAFVGPGFFLKRGDGGAPETFTTIANVGDISGPEMKRDLHDITNQSSPNAFEEMMPGLGRTGDVTFPLNWNPSDATHDQITGIQQDILQTILRNYQLVLGSSGKKLSFAAYCVDFVPKLPVNGVLRADIKLKPTGGYAVQS